jgi:hypothetical protein
MYLLMMVLCDMLQRYPLVNRGSFSIYRIVTISTTLKNKKLAYININKNLLSIDQARQYYFVFDQEELEECKTLEPIFIVNKNTICFLTIKMYLAIKIHQLMKGLTENCDLRMVEITNTIWVPLSSNKWIYFASSTDSFFQGSAN